MSPHATEARNVAREASRRDPSSTGPRVRSCRRAITSVTLSKTARSCDLVASSPRGYPSRPSRSDRGARHGSWERHTDSVSLVRACARSGSCQYLRGWSSPDLTSRSRARPEGTCGRNARPTSSTRTHTGDAAPERQARGPDVVGADDVPEGRQRVPRMLSRHLCRRQVGRCQVRNCVAKSISIVGRRGFLRARQVLEPGERLPDRARIRRVRRQARHFGTGRLEVVERQAILRPRRHPELRTCGQDPTLAFS